MKWLSAWRSTKLATAWTYSTHGQLWRLLPSTDGYLALEDRQAESKCVSFACLHAMTGEVLWRDLSFEERWWISLNTIHQDVVFLHEYATPDMPDEKKIYAVDIASGRLRWSNADLKFLFAHDGAVYAARDEYDRRRFFELDLHIGSVLREIDDGYLNVVRSTVVGAGLTQVRFPAHYVPGGEGGNTRYDRLEKFFRGVSDVEMAEVLEFDRHWIVGYYVKLHERSSQRALQQHLAVMAKDEERVIFRDVLTRNALMCAPDMFFSMRNHLYYVKERKCLSALNLEHL